MLFFSSKSLSYSPLLLLHLFSTKCQSNSERVRCVLSESPNMWHPHSAAFEGLSLACYVPMIWSRYSQSEYSCSPFHSALSTQATILFFPPVKTLCVVHGSLCLQVFGAASFSFLPSDACSELLSLARTLSKTTQCCFFSTILHFFKKNSFFFLYVNYIPTIFCSHWQTTRVETRTLFISVLRPGNNKWPFIYSFHKAWGDTKGVVYSRTLYKA